MKLFNKEKETVTITKAKFLFEIGQAYRRGVTEGALAERRGDSEFIDKHKINERLWESLNIRR